MKKKHIQIVQDKITCKGEEMNDNDIHQDKKREKELEK